MVVPLSFILINHHGLWEVKLIQEGLLIKNFVAPYTLTAILSSWSLVSSNKPNLMFLNSGCSWASEIRAFQGSSVFPVPFLRVIARACKMASVHRALVSYLLYDFGALGYAKVFPSEIGWLWVYLVSSAFPLKLRKQPYLH